MKLSTVNTISWVSTAALWTLFIVDIATPGKPPLALDAAFNVSFWVVIATYFYALGTKRQTNNLNINETSK